MAHLVYKIVNTITEMTYIGITSVSLKSRWSGHLHDCIKSNKPLYREMREYGTKNFIIEIIDTSCKTRIELENKEMEYILKYKTRHPEGYNLTGGNDPLNELFRMDVPDYLREYLNEMSAKLERDYFIEKGKTPETI